MRYLKICRAAAIAAAALIGMGCGSDIQDVTISSADMSKTQYLKRANALCLRNTKERFAAVEKVAREREATKDSIENQDLEEFARDIMLPRIDTLRAELAELGAPEGGQKRVETILSELAERVAVGEEEPNKFVKGGLFDTVNESFADYGLAGCRI